MEHLRSITITVEIDTNKNTYRAEFETMAEFEEWYLATLADIAGD